MTNSALIILEVVGICSFSISGSIIGIRKRLDAFGVLLCAFFTSFGGGMIRDIMIGNLPPMVFQDYTDLVFAVISSIISFLFAYKNKKHFEEDSPVIDRVNNVVDAMGLGLFTIIGINAGIAKGFGENAPFIIFLGVTTGIGGGMLRDISIREIPFVLTKRIYALASIAGGIVYYLMYVTFGLNYILCVITGTAVIFAIRILASIFKWDMPRAF